MTPLRIFGPSTLTAFVLCALSGAPAHAATYTWTQTAAGSYDWNNTSLWDPAGSIPNAPGDVANLNNDISGAQTVRLRQAITVGTVNIGDKVADATTPGNYAFSVTNLSGETFALTFDSGAANTAAQLNLGSSGTPSNTLGVPVALNSNLTINLGSGTQTLNFSSAGSLATGTGTSARNVTVTGGTASTNQFTLTGDLSGSGVFTNSGNAALIVAGTKTFTGTFVLNKGVGGGNTGSLTLTSGAIPDAAEVIINGYLTGGITQNGGSMAAGDNSARANPGQRFTQNRITLNGGTLIPNGQTLNTASTGTLVQDNVSVLDFNSGFSYVPVGVGGNSAGTLLNVTTLERSPGASAYIRSGTLGTTARVLAGNGSTFLKGGGGAEGSTTMSVIPWLGANNTGAGTTVPTGFATYTASGIRALDATTEYATSMAAGATANVSVGTYSAFSAPTTVNSFRYTSGSASNMGVGQVLTVASGGVFFSGNNGVIGSPGNAGAGTVAFGTAEGVVWTIGSNTDTIGAGISGAAGLSKAGTGSLILAGDNSYTGYTYVGGGTLQVGNGTNNSRLGLFGDVAVASGATLSLMNGLAIADTATLTLEQFGLFNGKLSLNTGVNETVAALFFGTAPAIAGTYGSTTSGATFQDDTFFSGNGVLTVIPEPGVAVSVLGGICTLVGFRRRRQG